MHEVLQHVESIGQSFWLDYLHRRTVDDGELGRMISDGGIKGLTSNPTIFEKAIAGDALYSERIGRLLDRGDKGAADLYERLAIGDIRAAADVLLPVYDKTKGIDGYACLEVSPYLAHDTTATVNEAYRLWAEIGRPNVMIKVPATPAGLPAITALIAGGINVNVTLLFSVEVYLQVAEAFLQGLERRVVRGLDIHHIASVASFFVSRIDTAIDAKLNARDSQPSQPLLSIDVKQDGRPPAQHSQGLAGKIGIANAKCAYAAFRDFVTCRRWRELVSKGARPQRLLWASTSVKNPNYPELMYAEGLMGPDTVDTLPPGTYRSFLKKGRAASHLTDGLDEAKSTMQALERTGIDFANVANELLDEGVFLFQDAFDKLMSLVEGRRREFLGAHLNSMQLSFTPELTATVARTAEVWRKDGAVRRLWQGDPSLWSNRDEASWLGWLTVVQKQRQQAITLHLQRASDLVIDLGTQHVILLGMGGSSLCPEVFARTFGPQRHHPMLHILDSTNPDQIRAVEGLVDMTKTLVVVASKSGSTLEPNVLQDHFLKRMRQAVGDEAPRRFIAITDPGSSLETAAMEAGFAAIFSGVPSIGGRYSALSNFGLVPATLMGIDVGKLLEITEPMIHSCASTVPPRRQSGRKPRYRSRRLRQCWSRQGYAPDVSQLRATGRLARAAARGVDRERGQGANSHRSRGYLGARRLRVRQTLRLSEPRRRA